MNKVGDLSQILTPAIKEQINQQFHPSDKILLVKGEEIEKFKLLVGDNGNDVANKFLSNKALCDYFLNKEELTNIKELTSEIINDYKIDFKGTELEIYNFLKDALIKEINNKENESNFKKILRNRDINPQNNIDFSDKELEFYKKEEIKIIDDFYKNGPQDDLESGLKQFLDALTGKENKIQSGESKSNNNNQETLKKQTKLNELFKGLLKGDTDPDQVARFFSGAINIDLSNINNNAGKLTDFFRDNKKELAYFFQNGGLGEFNNCLISTLVDGCSKNIGNQFTIALYSSLLKESPSDPILFQLLNQSIITAILNKHGGDVIENENNPLRNLTVQSYFLSPEALIKETAKTFYDQDAKPSIKENAWKIIGKILGENLKSKIAENIGYDDMNQKGAETAAYLVLQNTNDPTIQEKIGQSIKGKEIKGMIEGAKEDVKEDEITEALKKEENKKSTPKSFISLATVLQLEPDEITEALKKEENKKSRPKSSISLATVLKLEPPEKGVEK